LAERTRLFGLGVNSFVGRIVRHSGCMGLRFAVRTLAIFVTLVCAYFGAWEATKKYGVPSSFEFPPTHGVRASSPAPFVIRYDRLIFPSVKLTPSGLPDLDAIWKRSHVSLWLFGPEIPLPFEWEWESDGF
jgi:hypothetical protein